jgi:two-component system response regulator RegA
MNSGPSAPNSGRSESSESSESSGMAPSILIVDDDAVLRERLAVAFRARGYEAHTAEDHDSAIQSAERDSPEYALVDLRLPGRSGLEIVRALRAIDSETKIVVLTGYGSIATALDAVRLGATNYISKPADIDDILTAFARGNTPPSAPPASTFTSPSLARAEWEHINRVLSDSDGNVSEAARRLQIHRRSLQRKLQKYPPRD